jgi:hypothetical protein
MSKQPIISEALGTIQKLVAIGKEPQPWPGGFCPLVETCSKVDQLQREVEQLRAQLDATGGNQ